MYVIYKKDLTQSEAQNLSYTILKNLYYLSHPILQKTQCVLNWRFCAKLFDQWTVSSEEMLFILATPFFWEENWDGGGATKSVPLPPK